MSPVAVLLLSASMSVDAFAVAVGRGATETRGRLTEALRTGLVFGIVEAITPLLGWLAGIAAAGWVASFDHWLAFALLAAVGLHMIYGPFRPDEPGEAAPKKASLLILIVTALGTSVDAMAVGLSLAFIDLDLRGILAVSLGVGITTFVFAVIGMSLGNVIGSRFGKIAEVIAGLVLFAIGSVILWEHLVGA
ncbi:manganese efflux pump MntP family protein [Devosia salina]|uniref:Putative manganese efflux pump MntP n=1 Tax=Devosia salina TaxID=2860336 RepID=A0ABX8WH27_9HYPH|nr:manganese efflux pump MntP family protein [Devosia salina]QYO75590.1 manganese efflux pump MntP family protein [Devosia salina]